LSAARIAALAIDHARLQEELFLRAHHDSLTQLPNRRLCDDRITEAIARARRHDGKVGILCIDLDEFKQVNDTHGHDAGGLRAAHDRCPPAGTAARDRHVVARRRRRVSGGTATPLKIRAVIRSRTGHRYGLEFLSLANTQRREIVRFQSRGYPMP